MRRKFLSVVLCVCMMLTMAPFAFAEGETESENPTPPSRSSGSGSGSVTSTAGITTEDALRTAISAATAENKIVTLDGDIALTSQLTINTSITLNGNGHTIKANNSSWSTDNSSKHLVSIEAGSNEVTFNDVVFDCNNQADNIQAYKSGNVTFNNITVQNSKSTYADMIVNASSVTVTGTFTASKSINVGWGTNISDVTSCSFNAQEATLVGVSAVYTDSDDITHANDQTNNITKFTVNLPDGWVNAPSERTPIQYLPAVAKVGDTSYASISAAVGAIENAGTVTLLKDTAEDVTIPTSKAITLNLNDKTLTVSTDCGIELQGKLTVTGNGKITCANTPICVDGSSAELTVNDGTIESTNDYGIYAKNGGSAIVNGGTISSKNAALSGNNTTGSMNFTVNSGTLTAAQGPAIYMPGQVSLNISGGTLNGGVSLRMGQVNISGGTINAITENIDSPSQYYNYSGNAWLPDALYVFGGTYSDGDTEHGNSLNLNISGGIFNCANGQGSAVAIYDIGKVAQSANITISGNAKLATNASSRSSYQVLSLTDIGVDSPANGYGKTEYTNKVNSSITGGYFTTDPTAYLAKNKGLVDSDLAGYYKVGDSTVNVDTKVKAGAPSVSVPENSGLNKVDIENAAKSQATQASLAKAASSLTSDQSIVGTEDDAKKALGNKAQGEESITVVVQPYLEVDVTEVNTTDKTMSVNISALYDVIATTDPDNIRLSSEGENAANAVALKEKQNMSISKPVTIKLALPAGFAEAGSKLSIKHTKNNGSIEYYTGIVSTEGSGDNLKTYVTFTTNGFSPFVIYAASANVASIGDGENEQVFTSFQAAVDAVENGGTIKALKNIDSTVSGNKTFKVSTNDKTVKLTAASGYNLTNSGDTYTVSHQSSGGPGSSGGSISTPTTYAVNVNAATNGAMAADKKTASKGTTVTVTASPSKGYVVDAVKVVDKDGKDVAVTGKDGKYVFTMPGSAVTVTGTFKAETPAPVALPFSDVKSGNWFYDAVKYAYEQGLMTGTSATTFAPNGTMNRAMIVTVLYRLEKSPAVTGASKFTDVPAGQWYSDAVAWAAANKIVNGYDETTFGPMNAVTREQMAAILFRYEQVKGLENVTLEENLNRFPDQNKSSAYAIPALQWAVGQKIINGNADGTLDPTGTATRAQVAQIFTNLLNQ